MPYFGALSQLNVGYYYSAIVTVALTAQCFGYQLVCKGNSTGKAH